MQPKVLTDIFPKVFRKCWQSILSILRITSGSCAGKRTGTALAIVNYLATLFDSIFFFNLVKFHQNWTVLIVLSVICVQVAVIILIETDRYLLFFCNIDLKNNLLSVFRSNRKRKRYIVWFVESHNYMFEVRKNILLSYNYLTSSLQRVVFEIETHIWTNYLVILAKYWLKVKDLPICQIW